MTARLARDPRAPASAGGPGKGAPERFTVQLAHAAPVAELEAWMASAAGGARAVYASGIDLPAEAPAAALARRWAGEGRAHLFRERDRGDPRRWHFIVEKAREGSPCPPAPGPGGSLPITTARATPPDLARLLAILAALAPGADGGAACPSNAALARRLGHGRGGRARVQYLLGRARRAGLIAIESRGRNAPRRVTVLRPDDGPGAQDERGCDG